MAKLMNIRHKMVLVGALYAFSVAVVIGIAYQVVKLSSAHSDYVTTNTVKTATVDVAEYGLRLNYNAAPGMVTYAVIDNPGGNGGYSKTIQFTNTALKNPKTECEGENMSSYSRVASISVQPALDSASYIPTNYIQVGNEYLVFNTEDKMNMPVDDPCFSTTLDYGWGVQRSSLYDSFNAKATTNAS